MVAQDPQAEKVSKTGAAGLGETMRSKRRPKGPGLQEMQELNTKHAAIVIAAQGRMASYDAESGHVLV